MDSRLIRPRALPKPLLLKDYLLDDISSCSSNGFKSFPRRQCCTTVPFRYEFDLKTKQQQQRQKKKYLNFNKSPSKSTLSAFQRVITAVKRLPFSTIKSPEKVILKNSFLPRSFSKKLLRKSSFWKRKPEQKEIVPSKSFDELMKEDSVPSDRSYSSITTSESKSNCWSGTDLTVSSECSSGNSSSAVNLNLPYTSNDVVDEPKKVVIAKRAEIQNDDVPVESTTSSNGSAGTNSSTNTKEKEWSNEEKEQSSPVSVLDCPFDDDDEVSSPFQHRLARMEGTKKKLMKKIQMFECLAKLEPVSLDTRFASQPHSDNESIGPHSDNEEEQEEEEETDQKPLELLHQMKATLPSYSLFLKADKLLLDFFRERLITNEHEKSWFNEKLLLEEAEDWVKGKEVNIVGWEMQKNRQVYVREMEKGEEWKTLDQENQELVKELETQVFAALLNELVLDFSI